MREHHQGMRLEVGQEERAPVMQWVGLGLAPLAFAIHLQLGYVLITWSCVHDSNVWVHVAGIASVVMALAGGVAAWRTWMTGGRNVPGDHGGAIARTRMLGAIGVGVSTLITIILFVQWVATFFISVCQ